MTNYKQIERSYTQNPKIRLAVRHRALRRFNSKVLIDHAIKTAAITSLLMTGFAGVGAIGCWGMEIIETNTNPKIIFSSWQYQKNAYLGGMLVSFSAFLGTSLLGVSLNIGKDEFLK
jgi:hypothetical protein